MVSNFFSTLESNLLQKKPFENRARIAAVFAVRARPNVWNKCVVVSDSKKKLDENKNIHRQRQGGRGNLFSLTLQSLRPEVVVVVVVVVVDEHTFPFSACSARTIVYSVYIILLYYYVCFSLQFFAFFSWSERTYIGILLCAVQWHKNTNHIGTTS
uniref:Uncharacterized protein n=1 Tax=Schizaphis graminum TaxID=13262 RepID=A0A2S2PAX5_SCHGA